MYKSYRTEKYRPKIHGRVSKNSGPTRGKQKPYFGSMFSKRRSIALGYADKVPSCCLICPGWKKRTGYYRRDILLPAITGGYPTHGTIGKRGDNVQKGYNRAASKRSIDWE